MHKFLWSIIGISVTVVLSLYLGQSESEFVNAQHGNMSTVIEDKFTREIGTGQVMPPVSHSWVEVMYESPNTIILGGDLIASNRDVDQRLQPSDHWNTDLWASDGLVEKPIWVQITAGNDKWGWKRRKSHHCVYLDDKVEPSTRPRIVEFFLLCYL